MIPESQLAHVLPTRRTLERNTKVGCRESHFTSPVNEKRIPLL